MNQIDSLKNSIYKILEIAVCEQEKELNEGALKLIQKQNVAITRAVSKNSDINIIQLQSVRINTIVLETIEMFKIIDSIKDNYKIIPKPTDDNKYPREINYDYSDDPIFGFMEYLYTNKINALILKDYIKVKYFEFLCRRFPDHKEDEICDMMQLSKRSIYRSQKKIKGIFPVKGEKDEQ